MSADPPMAREHPFLICRRADFDALRRCATDPPWAQIAEAARRLLGERRYDPEAPVSVRGTQIRDRAGAAALLYLLEPEHAATYRSAITRLLAVWPAYLADVDRQWNGSGNRWLATVPVSSGYFNSLLALDLIHDDLAPADLATCEAHLAGVADWFWEEDRGWQMATYGPRALWAAYKNEDRLATALAQYRDAVFAQMTADGVGCNGPEYSHARLDGERTAKYGFLHVAEYTRLDPVYYGDPRLARFYEWLFAAGCSPFNTYVTFADSGHGRTFNTFYPQSGAWAAGRFSPLAAAYAAHRIAASDPPFPADLLAYCIARPLPKSRRPDSRIWRDGGALFYEREEGDQALMGALWNVSRPGHAHRDANAVYLAGYGEHLLLNSGYNGYGNPVGEFSWEYIHANARSSNTLALDAENHLCEGGDGVTEGLLTPVLDYACGRVERALPGAAFHDRSFLFVHPQTGTTGYFLLFDEVAPDQAESIHLYLHPASRAALVDEPDTRYTFTIRQRKQRPTYLTLYLATPPAQTQFEQGALAGWRESFVGSYLHATYAATCADRRLVTLLYPHDADHPLSALARHSSPGCTGVRIDHGGNLTDTALESAGDATATCDSATFQARATLYRCAAGALAFYFVRRGRSFLAGTDHSVGFRASAEVTLLMQDRSGRILSPGAAVTFHRPGLGQIRLDGRPVTPEDAAPDRARIVVPPGEHRVELE